MCCAAMLWCALLHTSQDLAMASESCMLLQASKVVEPYKPLVELSKQGFLPGNPQVAVPLSAVREAQTCVVPFWTKAEDFHVFVRLICCSPVCAIDQFHTPICVVIAHQSALLLRSHNIPLGPARAVCTVFGLVSPYQHSVAPHIAWQHARFA